MKLNCIVLLLLLMASCSSHSSNLYKFDPKALDENEISLAEIANDIIYIPLDNKIPLGNIYQPPKFINNSIFIFINNAGIIVFDKKGQILRKIGSIGRGPGEYVYGYKFAVDEKTETVYVVDISNRIKVYSRNGSFLRSFSLEKYGYIIDAFESYDSKLFASFAIQFENSKYDWILVDTLGNLVKDKKRTLPPFTSNFGGSCGIYKYKTLMHYWTIFSDTVFSVLPDFSEKASFIISPGEYRIPRIKLYTLELSQYILLENIFETDQFFAIRYFSLGKKNAVFALIDKHDRKSFLSHLESGGITWIGGIENNIDGGVRFLPGSYFTKEGREYMVGLQYPYQIKAHVASDEFKKSTPKYPEKKKELENLANSIKETDNPVLVLVRLKK